MGFDSSFALAIALRANIRHMQIGEADQIVVEGSIGQKAPDCADYRVYSCEGAPLAKHRHSTRNPRAEQVAQTSDIALVTSNWSRQVHFEWYVLAERSKHGDHRHGVPKTLNPESHHESPYTR